MSVVEIVVMILVIIATAWAVYAIYRYDVVPAIRSLKNETAFTGAWREGGWLYRLSLIGILVAVALATAAGALLMAGLSWEAGVAFLAAIAIVAFANFHRVRVLQRYQGQ